MTKKLHVTDFIRTFAAKFGKVTSIMLPFDSRKSRKFPRISQWLASDAHTYMAWAAPAVLLIRGVREPTWARYRRVCPRLLFLLIAIMPMAAVSQNGRQLKAQHVNSKTQKLIISSRTQKLIITLCPRSSKSAVASSQAESSSASTQATTPLRCPPTAVAPGLRVVPTPLTAPSATCSL